MRHDHFPWRPLGQLLIARGLLDEQDLEEALAEQDRTGKLLGEVLVNQGALSAVSLARVLAEQHGVTVRPAMPAAPAVSPPPAPLPSAPAPEPAAVATAPQWRPLGRLLVEQGFVRSADLAEALSEQQRSGGRLGEILVARGLLTAPGLARALAAQHGVSVEESQLEVRAEPALAPAARSAPVYEVREAFAGISTPGPVLFQSANFLEAADYAFEHIERREPEGIEIHLERGGSRETVWSYSASRAAAEAQGRKGLVETFGFDPTLWGTTQLP